jgi:hypothetical protein
MAKLREQRNVLKAMQEMHDNELVGKSSNQGKVEAMTGLYSELKILTSLHKKPVFLNEKHNDFPILPQQAGFYNRSAKLNSLVKSCEDAGFIAPCTNPFSAEKTNIIYYRITDRGSDILHFLGFWQIAFEKHSKLIIFTSGALTAFFVQATAVIVSNLHT